MRSHHAITSGNGASYVRIYGSGIAFAQPNSGPGGRMMPGDTGITDDEVERLALHLHRAEEYAAAQRRQRQIMDYEDLLEPFIADCALARRIAVHLVDADDLRETPL